ncbi:MAG: retrotransposon gag domain-containing protein [Shewanella sp.]|nr:retrotransposon gag domain-containing protein [Shewanella sp.]
MTKKLICRTRLYPWVSKHLILQATLILVNFKMAEKQQQQQVTEGNLGTLFQTLSNQIVALSSVVQAHSVSTIVPTYDGTPSKFKDWVKALGKYGMLTGCDDEKLKLLALQTSQGALSDFIHRWISTHQQKSWKDLKTELQTRFSEVVDRSYALSLLRQVKQKRDESVQIYAERLISLAEDAYQEAANTTELGQIERQLVGYFTDGLYYDFLKMKVMRDNPERLQTAVGIAMQEQNVRKRFNLRTGRDFEGRREEPMEVDASKPKRCQLCRKLGHEATTCRVRKREHAEAVQMVRAQTQAQPPTETGQQDRRASIRCWYCNQEGHIRARCEKFKQQFQAGPQAQTNRPPLN